MQKSFISNSDFKKQIEDFYNDNGIAKNYQPKIKTLHKAFEEYARRVDVEFKTDQSRREMNIITKGKTFLSKQNTELFKEDQAEEDENPF